MKNLFLLPVVLFLYSCGSIPNYADPAFMVRSEANLVIEEGGTIESAASLVRVQYFFPVEDAVTSVFWVESNFFYYKNKGNERIRFIRDDRDMNFARRFSSDEIPKKIDLNITDVTYPQDGEKLYIGIDMYTGEEFSVLIETISPNQFRYYLKKEGIEYQIVYLVVPSHIYSKDNF